MGVMTRMWMKLRVMRHKAAFDGELAEEMAFHRDEAARAMEADGMSAAMARRAAVRQFGNTTQHMENSRATMGFRVETVWQDLRFAVRQLRKNPGFAVTAILILALGMGASVAVFAFVDAALIKPLPYPEPARLVDVTERAAVFPRSNLSYPDYLDWKRTNRSLQSLSVYGGRGYLLRRPAGVEPVGGARVSDGFFRTLGVRPVVGRDFYDGEDLPSSSRAVMLSYSAWQKWFDGRRDAIGRAVELDGVPYTVVGVLPQGFAFAPRGRAEFWTALHPEGECDLRRSCHSLYGVGRLKDGVTVAQSDAEMKGIARELERQYPDSNRSQGANVRPLTEAVIGDVRPVLLLLLCGAGLLLLIACINVASLLLARSEGRRREVALRGALGATTARMLRQFATEGAVLVVCGSALGLVLAHWAMRLLILLVPTEMMAGMPFLRQVGLNGDVFAFAALMVAGVVVLLALIPALRMPFDAMQEGLAEGPRGGGGTAWRRLGSNLVVAELAVAMVLLVGAGLLGKSLYRLLHVELGFASDHLATVSVGLPQTGYEKDEPVVAVGRRMVERLRKLPGVQSAALTSLLPVSYNGNTDWIRFVGRAYNGEHNEVNERNVTADYFKTLDAKLVRGRMFTDAEDASKPLVVVINETLARRYFPGEDPVGKRFGDTQLTPKSIKEIVGVVADVKEGALDSEIWPAAYYPLNQATEHYFSAVVRTENDPRQLLPALPAALHEVEVNAGTMDEVTMEGRIQDSQSAYLHRSTAWLVGGFAGMALLLGVVGLYGVIAYSVSQRTREIGVRMALGAQRSTVHGMVLREAGRLAMAGIVVGVVSSLAVTTLLRGLLFGVRSWDVTTLLAVAAVLGVAAMVASYLPARRAASVNPMEALRAE